MLDEIGDGADFELVFLGKLHEIRLARHGAVVLHDLANDARRFETGKAGQVHGTLSLTRSNQDAAISGAQWKYVAGGDEIVGFCIVGDGVENRLGAIGSGNTGGDFWT